MLDLYTNIKNRRIELGMSQDTLAKKVGYTSRSTIARIEKGEIDISRTKILAFAEALNTTPAELLGWIDDTDEYSMSFMTYTSFEDLSHTEQEIMEKIQFLSTGNQIAVLGVIESLIQAQNDKGNRQEQI